jgi:predicted amidohydrolase YtcJ
MANKAFINGKIYTVNEKQPIADAVVTCGNTILFVGNKEDAQQHINEKTEIIDLNGQLMLPGIVDNHTHFTCGGFYLLGVDLRPAESVQEFRQILRDYVLTHNKEWVTGGNWDHEKWELKTEPVKEMIDDFSADTPIAVNRMDGHMLLANSLALKLAGITKDTPSPDGGLIVKDPKTNEPVGILKDKAMDLVKSVIREPTTAQHEKAVLAGLAEAKKNGITSVHDITDPSDLIVYQNLEKRGDLTCRFYTRLPINEFKGLAKVGIKHGFGSERLKVGSMKAFADGSIGSSTAWFFDPYVHDPTNCGLPMDIVTSGELSIWGLEADRNKLQLSVHAIGDKANNVVLQLFEDISQANLNWDRRFRIEHAQHVRPDDLARFKGLGVIASMQPYHCIDDGVWLEKKIGNRISGAYLFKSFLDTGIKLCFGSDWDVAPLNPMAGIYAAVTRRTLDGKNPDGWLPEQKISVADAIKCYTINSAYAAFEENIKGSIEPGKLADLVVLTEDILTIDPVEIINVKVDKTIFDGEVIYQG